MHLSFIFPLALWGLFLLPLLWLLAWFTRGPNRIRIGQTRYTTLLIIRSSILTALILAIAGAQIVRAVDNTAVVFLIDGSDSISPALRSEALTYINTSLTTAEADDQAAMVVFAGSSAVERAPSPALPLNQLTSIVPVGRTNIADAIQLGIALLPADAQKRIVILSDGGENMGRASDAAQLVALRNIPIDVVPLTQRSGDDIILTALIAPPEARADQTIPLRIRLQSSIASPARITIFADGQLITSQTVEVPIGSSEFSLNIPAGAAGFRRIEAQIEAIADTQPLNNRAAAFTLVDGPPHILLVASDSERATPLQSALQAAGMRADLILPAQIPTDQIRLHDYAAIILIDVLAMSVSDSAQKALITYVHDQGGGFAMIGGSESFGAGGWRRTPLAEILPVELDPPDRQDRPDLGLALVIDRSGSMSETVSGNRTKLDLAKEAVYQASLGMEQSDQIGVFAFDDSAYTALAMQPLPDITSIENALAGVSEGGGTDIRAGIELATREIANVNTKIRHVILLTDGQASDNYADLIDQMRTNGVTITIVAIGSDTNPTLQGIAMRGGGAYYRVANAGDVPEIFLAETVRVAQRDLIEETFTPSIALPAPPVRDLQSFPTLYGYNATTARDTARTLLTAPDDAPILAIWQYGLGRSLAWTSDMKGQWGKELIAWAEFPPFAAGIINALVPPTSDDNLSLDMRSEGPQAIIDLMINNSDNLAPTTIMGRLTNPAGSASDLNFSQIAANRYRAVVTSDQPGAYLAQVIALNSDQQAIGSISGGLVISYSPEYGPRSADPNLLNHIAQITNGRINPPAESLFTPSDQHVGQVQEIAIPLIWLALCLLPLDIGLRRIFLRREMLAQPFQRRSRPSKPNIEDPTITRLQAARMRAQRPSKPTTTPPPPAPVAPDVPPPPAPARPPTPDDPIANLLNAKQRRKK